MEIAVNFNRICRLCMTEEPQMSSIFMEQVGSVPLPLRIMACVSIEITAADLLPSQICNTCLFQVDNWYKFKDLCENADAALRRLVSNDSVNYEDITEIQEASRELKKRFALPNVADDVKEAEEEDESSSKAKSGEGRQNEIKGDKPWARISRSTGTRAREDDEKPHPLQVLTLQYNGQAELYASAGSEARDSESGDENEHSDDYSSDDSLTLFAHKEKLLREKETRKTEKTKTESCGKKRVSRTMQTQTGDDDYEETALEISINEVTEEGKKKRRNKRTQTQDEKKRFRVRPHVPSACNACDKVYKNAEILRQHIKSHHVSGDIECHYCQAKFSSLRSLKYHEQRNHSNLEPVPCSFCGKKFLDKKYLRIHENIHSQTNQYVCQFCGRKFIMKTNLTVHISRHHTQKTNDFVCQVCGKAFPFKLYLKKHFKTHTDYKPHSCSHCEARFRESTLLRKHINSIHLKLRPFACPYCEKTFTRSLYLREHTDSQHLGIPKKVECLRCGENLHNRSMLRLHECEERMQVLQ